MDVLVPFDARDPNTRLTPVLDRDERQAFARAMLGDVLDVLGESPHQPELLSTAPTDCACPVTVDERPLTPAVNDALAAREPPQAIVMADLALLTTGAVDRLCRPDADVVAAPGIGGGTNAMVVRHPEFRVDYHGTSFRDHRARARDCGATFTPVDSFRLGVDIDEPADLVELLLHTDGRAAEWLQTAGFELVNHGDRPTARRSDENG